MTGQSEHNKDSDFDHNISTILRALEAAVSLDKVAELARLVKPWMDGLIVEGVVARGVADQAREDVISRLRREDFALYEAEQRRSLEYAPVTHGEGGHE